MQKIPTSIQALIDSIQTAEHLSPKQINQLVAEANIQEEDLLPWTDFEHPLADGYGRKMVYDGGSFEIMVMSWNPGDFSAVHNHGYTEWGAVQIFGTAQHHTFNLKDNCLTTAKKEVLLPRQIVKVNNPLIHQMGNLTTRPYMTLHVYGCNHREKLVTADAKIYEFENSRIVTTSGGAFFNLPSAEVTLASEGLQTDQATFTDQAYYLLRLLHRVEQTEDVLAKKDRLLGQLQAYWDVVV